MFARRDVCFFIIAITFVITGYGCMAMDPVDNGFGVLTLWVAPPLLLAGWFLLLIGIVGVENITFRLLVRNMKTDIQKHAAALIVLTASLSAYVATLEPTASLWDCSEFIAASYKLQVPHSPGAPLFLLMARIFSMFSFGDVYQVAWCINLMSGLLSSLAVLLVYYIIYFFGEQVLPTAVKSRTPLLTVGSLGGSLCVAFSDTFWFSAVEAETYGAASFFLLLLVWLILRGKNTAEPLRSRWLIIIFYVAGLSYCVHPMCLLALAILPFAWYTHGRKLTWRNCILPVAGGLAIVLFINRFVAVGLFELAFSFDLFLVNNLGLPFFSGAILLVILLISMTFFMLKKYSRYTGYVWMVVFLLAGFTPYIMIFIRSNHNPPIDETNPENLSMIKAYMNRESYGSRPLLYGPYFDAPIDAVASKRKAFFKGESRYKVAGTFPEYHYENSRKTLLPRIYSRDENHIETYRNWTGLAPGARPGFIDNITFMVRHQLGHMYFRYLLWNFAGREGDVQGSAWLLPWEGIQLSGADKAKNQYWMIPFLMGVFGMVCQFRKDRKNFLINTVFFLITGVILALYLNATPNEPRERDYIYAGSFIAFSIWIGVGILMLGDVLSRSRMSVLVVGVVSVGIPFWMFYQNVDDHDRSGRTFQIDNARNTLNSCAPNSILFTGGDNDTFPFWYLQEVEGFRTDVRVVVLSYFKTDWYINQLQKQYYNSEPFRLTLDTWDYRQYGPNDVLYVDERIQDAIDVKQYLTLLKKEHPALAVITSSDDKYHILPSRTLQLPVDGRVSYGDSYVSFSAKKEPVRDLTIRVTGNYLEKNALAILDLLVSDNAGRPMYFNFTSMNTLGIDLKPYLIQEGLVYRLWPMEHDRKDVGINTALMYQNLVERSDYSNLSDASVYFTHEDYHLRMIDPLRQSFNILAEAFLKEENETMALAVLESALEKLYHRHLQPSFSNLHTAQLLMHLGEKEEAVSLTEWVYKFYHDRMKASNSISELDRYLLKESARMLEAWRVVEKVK